MEVTHINEIEGIVLFVDDIMRQNLTEVGIIFLPKDKDYILIYELL